MYARLRVAGAVLAVVAILAVVSCTPAGTTYSAAQVAEAAKGLKALVPAIEAGLSLAKPDSPTARAVTPGTILTSGVTNPWPYGLQTPAQVYSAALGTGTAGSTVRLPRSGYYQLSSLDQLYFTLTPESALGATYYRLVLYTYPAFDLTVAYTIEEYIVNDAGVEAWPWANLDLNRTPYRWVSLKTIYTDGTTGTRTVQSTSTAAPFYAAFLSSTTPDPDPATKATFDGYRYSEVTAAPPTASATTGTYSSSATEQVTGKGTVVDSAQYYTETAPTQHSALTTVVKDKKRHWAVPEYIVTRMWEDTAAGSKTIRSVGDLGPGTSYYIDKVDIALVGGKITYASTHDVYSNAAVPKGGNASANAYVSISLTEDGLDAGTFTGTMEEKDGNERLSHTIKVARDRHNQLAVSVDVARSAVDGLSIPMTQLDISALSVPLSVIGGTFEGYYEAGSLFGRVTVGDQLFDVVIAAEGVAVDDQLFAY